MRPKHSQVFLINNHTAQRIVDVISTTTGNNPIVEIGPGTGILTKFLYPRYLDKYTGVEIDPKMIEILKQTFPDIRIIEADFLKLNDEIKEFSYFCGNLPYHISTAILEKVIDMPNFKAAVFMFQKEVAKKITATPSSSDYGYLSALINLTNHTEYLFSISRYDFKPVPKVDSALVKIIKKDSIPDKEELLPYRRFISYAFKHKRKTLINSLSLSLPQLELKDKISSILKNKNIPLNTRAEELSPSTLFELSKEFKELLVDKR